MVKNAQKTQNPAFFPHLKPEKTEKSGLDKSTNPEKFGYLGLGVGVNLLSFQVFRVSVPVWVQKPEPDFFFGWVRVPESVKYNENFKKLSSVYFWKFNVNCQTWRNKHIIST